MTDEVEEGAAQPEATSETEQAQQIEVPEKAESTTETERAAPKPEAATAPQGDPKWWKPDLFKLKYRGTQVSPRNYNHAVSLMQQGWSYSQAMEALNRERSELQTQGKLYEQYGALDKAFKTNPAFAAKIWQMYQEAQGQQQPAGQPQAQPQANDPRMQQLFSVVLGLQEKLKGYDDREADTEVQSEMKDLRESIPDAQWDATTESGHTLMWDVLNHACQQGFPNLKAAARDYLWDSQAATAKMAGAKQAAEARMKAAKAGVVGTGGNKPAQGAGKTVNVKDVSYDDLTRMALDSLGIKH